tara:strand:+ start:5445 stop:5969 length:525 start_codon:yes stop_codon:yes gene_type:complete
MCDPILIGGGLGLAQAYTSMQGQAATAAAQAKAQSNQTKAEQQRLLQQQSAERINQRFQQDQVADQKQKAALQAREAQATARVSAAESGVAGVSVDSLMNDLARKEAVMSYGLTRQLEQSDYATSLRLQDNALGSSQRLLSINRPIEQPDMFGSILGGVSTGISAYGTLSSVKT